MNHTPHVYVGSKEDMINSLPCAQCHLGRWDPTASHTFPLTGQPDPQPDNRIPVKQNKYAREIHGVQIDFYDIASAYGITDPAIAHAMKKLLRYGSGEKSLAKDVTEAIWSLQRWQQMHPEAK